MLQLRGLFKASSSTNILKRASWVAGAEMINRITRIVTVIALARSMGIAEFGMAMAALTVHEIVRMFFLNGMGTRVVTVSNDMLASTAGAVHVLNWWLSAILCVLQLLLAWIVAIHFGSTELGSAIAVLAFVHIIYPFAMVQVYLAQRQDRWGVVGFAIAAQAATDNILTAVLALLGFGIWSVVIPKLIIAIGWVVFHRRSTTWSSSASSGTYDFRDLKKYSSNVMGVELLATLRAHGDKLLVGIFLGSTALGIYSFATNIGRGITLSLSQGLSLVVLPHLCRARDSGQLQKSHVQTMLVMTLAVAPIALLQAVFADWFIPLLFGAKWSAASQLVSIFALASLAHPVIAATSQMLRADGRVHEDLRIAILLSSSYFVALLAALPHGLIAAAIATACVQLTAAVFVAIYGFRSPSK